MSYATKGRDSSVYVYSDGNHLHCLDCMLDTDLDTISLDSYPAMLAHLAEHQAAGHQVPYAALEKLQREAAISPSVAEVSRLLDAGLVLPLD